MIAAEKQLTLLQAVSDRIKKKRLTEPEQLKDYLTATPWESETARAAFAAFYTYQVELTEGKSTNEEARRPANYTLLRELARERGLRISVEMKQPLDKVPRRKKPDAMLLTHTRPARIIGSWEGGTPGKLEAKIHEKRECGYDFTNLLFEDCGLKAKLCRGQRESNTIAIDDVQAYGNLLADFFSEADLLRTRFDQASREFRRTLPSLARELHAHLEEHKGRGSVDLARACRVISQHFGGHKVNEADVIEMLVQHMLTRKLFSVLYETEIEAIHPMAGQMRLLREKLLPEHQASALWQNLTAYYDTLRQPARAMSSQPEAGEQLLKDVYQEFYAAYNPNARDKLGIIYTPQPLVEFMVRMADGVLQEHFGVGLDSPEVSVLDPSTGTGTFVTAIMRHLHATGAVKELIAKCTHARSRQGMLWANEVSILASYVASLAIEQCYVRLLQPKGLPREGHGIHAWFRGLCYQDTLALPLCGQGSQQSFEGAGFSEENTERVERQRKASIRLVIGNPPWRASRKTAMKGSIHANYPELDSKIDYIQENFKPKIWDSQKINFNDSYKRFMAGTFAPTKAIWSMDNRTAGYRVCGARK